MPQIDLNAWRENIQGCQIGGKNVKVGESAFPTPCTSCICSNEGVSLNTNALYNRHKTQKNTKYTYLDLCQSNR